MKIILSGITALCLSTSVALCQAGVKQQAVIHIESECEDPGSGKIATPSPQGTGFVFDKSGYILTAFHVVSCLDSDSKKNWRRKKTFVRLGSPNEQPAWKAELVGADERSDLAVLKIAGTPRDFAAIPVCSLRKPALNLPFIAIGFPEGKGYQSIDGRVGNTDGEAGRWSVAAPFSPGMSGGPVLHNGFAIGIIKGGHKDVMALREIIPIYKASILASNETGQQFPECSSDAGASLAASRETPFLSFSGPKLWSSNNELSRYASGEWLLGTSGDSQFSFKTRILGRDANATYFLDRTGSNVEKAIFIFSEQAQYNITSGRDEGSHKRVEELCVHFKKALISNLMSIGWLPQGKPLELDEEIPQPKDACPSGGGETDCEYYHRKRTTEATFGYDQSRLKFSAQWVEKSRAWSIRTGSRQLVTRGSMSYHCSIGIELSKN